MHSFHAFIIHLFIHFSQLITSVIHFKHSLILSCINFSGFSDFIDLSDLSILAILACLDIFSDSILIRDKLQFLNVNENPTAKSDNFKIVNLTYCLEGESQNI